MKNSTKKLNGLLVLAVDLLLQGCVSFATGPECDLANTGAETEQLSVLSVSRVRAKVESVPTSSGVYILKLVADGHFILHKGYYKRVGTPCMSVGLWPSCAYRKDKGTMVWGAIPANFVMFGIPTLITLFIEPFREYRERKSGSEFDLADVGLIGFEKYYRDCHKDKLGRFQTESTTDITSCELYGFAVMIDGVRYEDKNDGSGYTGKVYFGTRHPSGSQINIRIIKAPSARADSKDSFSGIEGMEIPACLP